MITEVESNIELTQASSIEECRQAMHVALSSFYPQGYSTAQQESWHYRWFEDPTFLPERVLLAKQENRIIGGIRVKPIILGRRTQFYDCLGIADIFTTVDMRGHGVASLIVKFAIQLSEREKHDLIIGVARKRTDGFYLKHNFFGIGSYPKIMMKEMRASRKFRQCEIGKYTFRPQAYSPLFNKMYERCYGNVFGRTIRTDADWKFILGSLNYNQHQCLGIFDDDKLVGYVIFQQNIVMELSFEQHIDGVTLVHDLSTLLGHDEIQFDISPLHAIMDINIGCEVSVIQRECFYGGHIVKIINIENVIQKFILRDEVRLSHANEFSFPLSYDATKLLLGIHGQFRATPAGLDKFSTMPFCISRIDEF